MVQVNLLSKKKGVRKKRNTFAIVGLTVFGLFSLFFLIQVIMLIIRFVSVNQKLKTVAQDTEEISGQMLKDNEKLNRFILTKFILGEILVLRDGQFDYAKYIDEAQSLLTFGSEMSGIDFETSGFVRMSINTNTANELAILEKSLKTTDLSKSAYDNIVIKSVLRDSDGLFKTEVLLGIKKTNGHK